MSTAALPEHRVIIVGAGPAGISTALHLAQIAPDLVPATLILEKARHPRPKLCAGGILPDGEVILRHLGLDINEIPHMDVGWAHFDYDGCGLVMRAKDDMPYAFRGVQRDEFDAWLAEKARQRGFAIQEETAVQKVEVTGQEVHLETNRGRYTACVVVGADGSNSIVRRAVIGPGGPPLARLLEVYTPLKPESTSHKKADSYFDFVCVPDGIAGYVWDFPALVKGQPMRCRGVYDANHTLRANRRHLPDVLEEEFRRHGLQLADYDIKGHPIRWFEKSSPLSAPRVVLVGDAAGVDALYGEGISIALGYGRIAAEAIRNAFETGDFSFTGYRQRVLKDPMGIALKRRTLCSKFIYGLMHPAIQAFIWRRLGWLVKWLVQTFLIGWAERQESHLRTLRMNSGEFNARSNRNVR